MFGKRAGFFSTNVNSIALDAIKWRYLDIYCGWIAFEFLIVFSLYPETSGRTLEELAFRESMEPALRIAPCRILTGLCSFRGQGLQREDGRCRGEKHPLRSCYRQCPREPSTHGQVEQDLIASLFSVIFSSMPQKACPIIFHLLVCLISCVIVETEQRSTFAKRRHYYIYHQRGPALEILATR